MTVEPKLDTGSRSRWTPELLLQAFKEVVTAVLGFIVVWNTLVLAGQLSTYARTASGALDQQRIGALKDVLLIVMGLAGVIIGYYFGRVPADARAAQAQVRADEATEHAETVSAGARAVADQIDRVMGAAAAGAVGPVPEAAAGAPAAAEAMRELAGLSDQLRTVATR